RVVGQCGRYSIAEFLRSLAVGGEYFAVSALQYPLVSWARAFRRAASALLVRFPSPASNALRMLSTRKCLRKSERPSPSYRHTGVFGIVPDPLLDNQPNLVQVGSERWTNGTRRVLHDLRLLHAIKQASKIGHANRIRPSICILLAHFIQRQHRRSGLNRQWCGLFRFRLNR